MLPRECLIGFFALFFFVLTEGGVWAQSRSFEELEIELIEAEIQRNADRIFTGTALSAKKRRDQPKGTSTKTEEMEESQEEREGKETVSSQGATGGLDSSTLQAFSEVSVLQRRYMPKSGRVQIYGGLSSVVNDPWSSTNGYNGRLAYGITEAFGIEVAVYGLDSTLSRAAMRLSEQHNINSQSFGTTSGFTGGYLMWTPFYGKLSYRQQKIVSFDTYVNFGYGSTVINTVQPGKQGVSISSTQGFSLGGGQVYSINRSFGLRWDLTWNRYDLPIGGVDNLLFTLGFSLYVPEASYR